MLLPKYDFYLTSGELFFFFSWRVLTNLPYLVRVMTLNIYKSLHRLIKNSSVRLTSGSKENTGRSPFSIPFLTYYKCRFMSGTQGKLPHLGCLQMEIFHMGVLWQGLLPILCLLPLSSCGTGSCSYELHSGCLAFSDRPGEESGFAWFFVC